MAIVFASFCPHPPILLPSVGSKEDRAKLKKTLSSLNVLAEKFEKARPELVIISSPHSDWGFNVPLYFLTPGFKGQIQTHLTGSENLQFYFEKGQKVSSELRPDRKYALIASGDLSHCLKEDGPYGFYPDGPKFDKALIESLEKKDIERFLKLDSEFPNAAECGLRSFCFLLGVLEASGFSWQPEILSYEGPFGVGYLVAIFTIS